MSHSKGNILIVDDEPSICTVIGDYLRLQGYQCATAHEVDGAVSLLREHRVDCVLSDIRMPGRSGIDLLKEVQSQWPETAVILFTGNAEIPTAVASMQEGAYDFILKPIQLKQVVHSIGNALEKRRLKEEVRLYQQNLEQLVQERTGQIQEAMQALEVSNLDTINRLCYAAEFRDDETGFHVLRISRYCEVLARALGFSEEEVFLLGKASPLHDIGKIGIPDSILLKPGRLTREEFDVMKKHTEIGGQILKNADSKVLKVAQVVALSHHEKWDGNGYPNGLKGEDIPVMGRITAVADVFDALTMKRCYKPAFTLETSTNIINEGAGNHFDPKIVEAFNANLKEFISIQREYTD
jgi:putative two-component system response regulator